MAPKESRYTLVRDDADKRDLIYSAGPADRLHQLPPQVDLRKTCPPVLNQGRIATCTAHAIGAAFAYEQRVQKIRPITPSRLFIYYNERALTGQSSLNCVVRLRDAIKATAKIGVCPEHMWPYSEDTRILQKKPPNHVFYAAKSRKLVAYHRIPMRTDKPKVFLKHLKHCLAEGHPFVFGFIVYESFEKNVRGTWKSGVMPVPKPHVEKSKGGHAVMAVGYDDRRQTVLVRSSWGPKWGLDGHFRMPYKVITDPGFAFDFWTIRGVTG